MESALTKEKAIRCYCACALHDLRWIDSLLERCSGLEFGVKELGEVGHHAELIHLGVDHVLRFKELFM